MHRPPTLFETVRVRSLLATEILGYLKKVIDDQDREVKKDRILDHLSNPPDRAGGDGLGEMPFESIRQDVRVSVDALPDVALDGVLREVALRAGDYRGDVVYGVTVELRDAVAVSALRWGMTAVVQIQVE